MPNHCWAVESEVGRTKLAHYLRFSLQGGIDA